MENSKISWTDHTFNPWSGCTKVSAGCANCYAEALMDKRFGEVQWGPAGTRKRTSPANWRKPLQWNRHVWSECSFCGVRGDYLSCPVCDSLDMRPARQRVFCASLADVFEDRPELVEWRQDLFRLILATPNLDWLLLTKRPENVISMTIWGAPGCRMPDNVWIGTSVENQQTADERIPHLLKVPATVRFLSMEPLLGPVDFRKVPGFNRIGLDLSGWWVIVGGESGPNARPMHPEWVRSIRDQCVSAGVPFHFKQWGEWSPNVIVDDEKSHKMYQYATGLTVKTFGGEVPISLRMKHVGKKAAGRLLDGRVWDEYQKGQR